MKAKIKELLATPPNPQHLTYQAVQQIIGKSRYTIHRAIKDGVLEKIGTGRGVRITLASVRRYLDQQREIATVASTAGVSIRKAQEFARRKREEDRLKRALELVDNNTAQAQAAIPNDDPRLECVVFEGIAMSAAERDEELERRELARRRQALGFRMVRGV